MEQIHAFHCHQNVAEPQAHHLGSGGVADIVSVTMPLLNIKDLAVARERVELLIAFCGR